jgi:hypothetical protein
VVVVVDEAVTATAEVETVAFVLACKTASICFVA